MTTDRSARRSRHIRMLLLVPLLAIALASPAAAAVEPLPVGTQADYQLGGPRTVPATVGIVVRDRTAAPLADRYNVCYVNGFQTQPDENRFWKARMGLVLKRKGRPVRDEAWGEWLLDIRTSSRRTKLTRIMTSWINRCAASGYDAVEFDNLDSFTRSRGLIKRKHALAFAKRLVRASHTAGLAAGQKNLSGFDGRTIGFDFAVAEECGRYRECADYVANYGRRVLAIEYRRADFQWTCARHGTQLPVVLRDLELSPRGLREWC